jgi:hypothetical protein
MEGTVIENGSKWSKKHKRRSEVRENELLNENIKEDRLARKYGSWTTEKEKKKTTTSSLDHLVEKKEIVCMLAKP